jgi:hypothetical protein
LFEKGTEIMFGLLKTEILTNDFSKFSSKPTENNISYQGKEKNKISGKYFLSITTHKCNHWTKLRGF